MASTIVPSQAAPKNQSKIDKPLNNELILINLHLNRPTQLKRIMTGFFSLSNMVFPYLFIGGRATLNPLDYTWEQRGNVVIVHNPIPVQSLKVFLDDLGKKYHPKCMSFWESKARALPNHISSPCIFRLKEARLESMIPSSAILNASFRPPPQKYHFRNPWRCIPFIKSIRKPRATCRFNAFRFRPSQVCYLLCFWDSIFF